MDSKGKIKERMKDAVAQSYYRPWYKRVWARIIFVFLGITIIGGLVFGFMVWSDVRHLNKGEIYNEELGIWMTEDQYIASQKLAADILTDDDPWLGSDEPVVNIIAYESFGCPYCAGDQEAIKEMIAKFGPIVRFTARDFPTEGLHPGVFEAHLAAACANDQGQYWEFRDKVFADQESFSKARLKLYAKEMSMDIQEFDKCLDDEIHNQEIRQDYAEGVEVGVEGTPSYLVNGNLIPGSISYELWEQIIGYIIAGDY